MPRMRRGLRCPQDFRHARWLSFLRTERGVRLSVIAAGSILNKLGLTSEEKFAMRPLSVWAFLPSGNIETGGTKAAFNEGSKAYLILCRWNLGHTHSQ